MTLYLGNNLISGVATPTEPTRNLGQIIGSIIPLTDAGLHLLDGALINGSGIYSAFVDAIADLVTDYPDLFETEANWQSAVTTYGVCGKFVYDDINNTVRLPKITGILDGTTDVTALGDLIEQYVKLPNITGSTSHVLINNNTVSSGAFSTYENATSGVQGSGTSARVRTINFNASSSSSVYSGNGSDTKIQPQAIKCFYYIVIATTTKTEIEVDIDEITTDLNGKADVDLTNCTKPHITETYVNGTSWYRVYSDGWCEQGGVSSNTVNTGIQVNLLKPYVNTNYSVFVSPINGDAYGTYAYGTSYRTVSDFKVYSNSTTTSSNRPAMWRTSGYIS